MPAADKTYYWDDVMMYVPVAPSQVMVDFNVDMSQYGSSFTTVYLSGSMNNWSSNANPLMDQGNGVWSATVPVNANSSHFYKFQVDGWTDQESLSAVDACAGNNNGNYDRTLTVGMMDTTLASRSFCQ